MAAQMILKRGKRTVSSNIKLECTRNNIDQLKTVLDHLLDVTNPIDNYENIEWCRCLLAGGQDFDDFSKSVQQYDSAVACGLVWTANFVAYRCRTCAKSPCMSLCAECFNLADHAGHDYNMFRSQAGGACDCGDVDVMHDHGFCPRHGPGRVTQQSIPPDLLAVAKTMVPRLFWRLIIHLRLHAIPATLTSYVSAITDANHLLSLLDSLSDMKAAMREIMTQALLDNNSYTALCNELLPKQNDIEQQSTPAPPYTSSCSYSQTAADNYKEAMSLMEYPEEFGKYNLSGLTGLDQTIEHTTLLDELVFWMLHYQFPEVIVTLLLSLLPNDQYKEAFTISFVKHYSRISMSLVNSTDRQTVANRVVHISVQLFSNKTLAVAMMKDYNLHYTLVVSLSQMMEQRLTCCTLQDQESNFHLVMSCANSVMKDHCYWPVVSDFINILSHDTIAFTFLSDQRLLRLWLEMLTYFQGMNVNQRELTHHVDYESDTYYTAFSAELEICASPMWSVLQHCCNQTTKEHSTHMISLCFEALRDWFTAVGFSENAVPNPYQLTFHLPLHRYAATFLSNGLHKQNVTMDTVLPTDTLLKMVMEHPLQIQVGLAEVHANMWVRNGLQIKGQSMTYVQCHFCYSMVDADLYMLQVCASQLDPDYFVKTVIDRFHISDWLSLHCTTQPTPEQLALVEAALSLLASLQSAHTFMGIDEEKLLRKEMCTLLCFSDRTHSQTHDYLPEKSGIPGHKHETLDAVLADIAEYKVPNSDSANKMLQGIYVPKDTLWDKEFDPMHALLRMVQRKDFQTAMDRYADSLKKRGIYTDKHPPWPPFRLPGKIDDNYTGLRKLLHCKTMHSLLFSILHKAVQIPTIPESVVYFCVYLLNMAICLPSSAPSSLTSISSNHDSNHSDHYPGNDISYNIHYTIANVVVEQKESTGDFQTGALPSGPGGPIASAQIGVFPSLSLVHPSTTETTVKHDYHGTYSQAQSTSNVTSITIDESIVSLLYKLHSRYAPSNRYIPESVQSDTSLDTKTAGDGAFYIGKLLRKIASLNEDCLRHDELVYRRLNQEVLATPDKGRKSSSAHDKRKKAKNRQEKLMAEFASKQKAFMDQAKPSETEEMDETCGTTEYECVICGQWSMSTDERPLTLAVLLQSSSVLGRCSTIEEAAPLQIDTSFTSPPRISIKQHQQTRFDTLNKYFDEDSCELSVNSGWEGGVYIHSCGHYVHLDCHTAYVKSLTTQVNIAHQLKVDKGEYFCPLCRQLCNGVIPLLGESTLAVLSTDPSNVRKRVTDVAGMMAQNQTLNTSSPLTKCMMGLLEDITKLTQPMNRMSGKPNSNSILMFVTSVVRTNLELELLERGGNLCTEPTSKKPAFLPLLKVLAANSKFLTVQPQMYTELWSHISGVPHTEDTQSLTMYKKAVPLLLKDLVAVLIYLVLALPTSVDIDHFHAVVQMVYNVVYIQGLAVIACKFSGDERSAWKQTGRQACASSLEGLMSHVITRLECSRIFDEDASSPPSLSFSQDVWTPLSVDSLLADHCTHFLRVAALLQSHYFSAKLPKLKTGQTEFQLLTTYLCLNQSNQSPTEATPTSSGRSTFLQSYQGGCTQCLLWAVDERLTLTRSWCMDLVYFINQQPAVSRALLTTHHTFHRPHLIGLPCDYYRIFQHYIKEKCRVCVSVPAHPALCLVCGAFLCFKQMCCRQEHVFECVQHSVTCGAGTGIFLLVNSSAIMIIHGSRAALWGSLYLDDHGEEDRDLKRGKPLYLNDARYKLLESQWTSHSFDQACKRWIWHQNRF